MGANKLKRNNYYLHQLSVYKFFYYLVYIRNKYFLIYTAVVEYGHTYIDDLKPHGSVDLSRGQTITG